MQTINVNFPNIIGEIRTQDANGNAHALVINGGIPSNGVVIPDDEPFNEWFQQQGMQASDDKQADDDFNYAKMAAWPTETKRSNLQFIMDRMQIQFGQLITGGMPNAFAGVKKSIETADDAFLTEMYNQLFFKGERTAS